MAAARALGSSRRFRAVQRTFAALLAASSVAIAGGHGAPDASAGPRYTYRTRRIVPGMTLTRIIDARGPNRIRVLRIDLSTRLTMDVALANDVLPRRETTSSMARRHGAIAAVNGNFGNDWGRPLGLLIEDGILKAGPLQPGGGFSVARNESASYIGWPKLALEATNDETGITWYVKDWNELFPRRARIAGYTKAGGTVVRPPEDSCSVRLLPVSRLAWMPGRMGIARDYRVDAVQCAEEPLPLGGGMVFAAQRGTRAGARLALAVPGETVRFHWSVEWPGAFDVLAGNPVLIRDGEIRVEPCSGYVCRRHPRTGVAITPKGRILLVVVDGRSSKSVGMGIVQFANLMKHLGAKHALNLDGGGSTTMVVKGRILNTPSDGRERRVTSALLVLPRRDLQERAPLGP